LGKGQKTLLKIEDLVVCYGAVKVLHKIAISIKEGEIVGVLGPNGAGKTTLLMTISGILRQNEGKILFKDKNLIKVSPSDIVKMGIAHCPEGRHVFPELTVRENLEIGAYIRKDKEIVNKEIDNMFTKFPILGRRQSQPAGTLSGGEQQMLAISRALLSKPRLLLLDEPSLGLAPIIIEEVFKIIKEIHDDDVSVLIVEQNARMTLNVVDRAYILESGKIKTQGSSFDLKNNETVKKIYLGID
jgi:branched-chain amino acid transport system ATP-binding protein